MLLWSVSHPPYSFGMCISELLTQICNRILNKCIISLKKEIFFFLNVFYTIEFCVMLCLKKKLYTHFNLIGN